MMSVLESIDRFVAELQRLVRVEDRALDACPFKNPAMRWPFLFWETSDEQTF